MITTEIINKNKKQSKQNKQMIPKLRYLIIRLLMHHLMVKVKVIMWS